MVGKTIPLFSKGNILTKEMLEALKEFAVSTGELSYLGYSDGILRGCEVTTTEDLITLNEGIMIFGESAYYITEPVTHVYRPTNEWTILKASLQEEVQTENFLSRKIDIVLTSEHQLSDTDIEICRFKLQPGAKLRYRYKDFTDLATEFDTIVELYAKWAAYINTSISPKILRTFYEEAVSHPLKEMWDISFCQLLSEGKGETINRSTISAYLCHRAGKPFKLCDNKEIFDGLKEVLRQIKGGNAASTNIRKREHRIIVD